MKLGNDLKRKIKRLLLDDIFEDLTSLHKKDISIFNIKKLDKKIDEVIGLARRLYTK